jgi:hypothetical protein
MTNCSQNNNDTASSSLEINAYVQHVLEEIAKDTRIEDSLGSYITEALRRSLADRPPLLPSSLLQSLHFEEELDVNDIDDYEGLLELVHEQCGVPVQVAQSALRRIVVAVSTNRLPADYQVQRGSGTASTSSTLSTTSSSSSSSSSTLATAAHYPSPLALSPLAPPHVAPTAPLELLPPPHAASWGFQPYQEEEPHHIQQPEQDYLYALDTFLSTSPVVLEFGICPQAAGEAILAARSDLAAAEALLLEALQAPPVCRHLLSHGCYRRDCTYSHDIETYTCTYWLRGRCEKEACPFRHGFGRAQQQQPDEEAFPFHSPWPLTQNHHYYPAEFLPPPPPTDEASFPTLSAAAATPQRKAKEGQARTLSSAASSWVPPTSTTK